MAAPRPLALLLLLLAAAMAEKISTAEAAIPRRSLSVAEAPAPASPSSFVLVHGGWQGSYVWAGVIALLKAQGHTAIAVNLPGHGIDPTPTDLITSNDNATLAVATVVEASPVPVILVGHSDGGIAISLVAELLPSKVAAVVYVSGLLLSNRSVDEAILPFPSLLTENIVPVESPLGTPLALSVNPDLIGAIFYSNGPAHVKEEAALLYRDEPFLPFEEVNPVISADLPRYYVYTPEDLALTIEFQEDMVEQADQVLKRNITTFTVPHADHGFFVYHPEPLVEILLLILASP